MWQTLTLLKHCLKQLSSNVQRQDQINAYRPPIIIGHGLGPRAKQSKKKQESGASEQCTHSRRRNTWNFSKRRQCFQTLPDIAQLLTGRDVDSHRVARENIFAGPLCGKFFWIFLFKMAHSGVLYISERQRGFKRCGARGNNPLLHLDGPANTKEERLFCVLTVLGMS